MPIFDKLSKIATSLYGQTVSDTETEMLRNELPGGLIPPWLLEMLKAFPLAGVMFSLPEGKDESRLGIDLMWMTPTQIIDEARSAYPGISVLPQRYLPIGSCLTGSGDPYFLRLEDSSDDPALVRVPHGSVPSDDRLPYPEDEIELVCGTLSQFFSAASIE